MRSIVGTIYNLRVMKKIVLSTLLTLLCTSFSMAQTAEGFIYWKKNRPLQWSDFKGIPVKNSHYHAQTQGGLNYTFDNNGPGVYVFKLNVKYDKQKSWSKREEQSDDLLKHEQGHFDIYEIYGRLIMQRLKETKALAGPKFSEKVEKIFTKSFAELQKFQRKYDQETNHSKDKEKQEKWNQKLEKMLIDSEDHIVKEIEFKV